jgi:glycerol-3-phosphate dehydrogenase
MKRDLEGAAKKKYDLIIIGGGMFGACAAWEATQRGLSVVLLEKNDFCGATSANHLKMVHGGIRYLQHGDIYRLRESVNERSAFLRIAPHLVQPLPVVMPTYGHGMKGKEILSTGMTIYDFLTMDRNSGIKDETRKIPNCYSKSKEEVISEFPGIEQQNLTGAAVFTDAQMYNPPRLVLSFIQTAVENGANAFNYTEVFDVISKNNKVIGVKVSDKINGSDFEIMGDFILNTSGPWTYNLLDKLLKVKITPKPAFSRDAAFVVNKQINPEYALAVPLKTKDVDAILDRGGRHVFIAPWLNKKQTLVGVWHVVWGESENKIYVREEELQNFIREVNEAYPAFDLSLDDVSLINTGLTLFGESKPGSTRMSFGKRSRIIDHEEEHNLKGIISLIGVRATVARWDSQKVISKIAIKLGKSVDKSKTRELPIHGGNIENFENFVSDLLTKYKEDYSENTIKDLSHNYGSNCNAVIKLAETEPELKKNIEGTNKLKSEIIYAIRNEMAVKLSDIIVRRTDIGTSKFPGDLTIDQCSKIMGKELLWTDNKILEEANQVKKMFENFSSVKNYTI